MKKDQPKCSSCGQYMFEIGGIGKTNEFCEVVDGKIEIIGRKEVTQNLAEIYQISLK